VDYLGEVMNIRELAKQVGYPIQHEEWRKATEEFAVLIEAAARADEREACAKVCEKSDRYRGDYFAAVIRARGTT
jgi:RNA:NAD 2'-phosphotransferase (TPT1/KptA family)